MESDLRAVTKELIGDSGDPSTYELTKINIGTINFCYFVTTPSKSVVVRISRDVKGQQSSQHLGSSKNSERLLLGLVSEHQVGPPLLGEFENGLITQRMGGRHLTPEEIPVHATSIAKLVAKLHSIRLTQQQQSLLKASVWEKMQTWLNLAKDTIGPDDYMYLLQEFTDIRAILDTSEYNAKVLMHGDLNHGNIIHDSERAEFSLVDFEFAGYGEKLFDLANHFCEHSGLDLNWDLYPSTSQQLHFLSVYLRESLGTQPDSLMVENLQHKVNKYQLASHLYWGIWAYLMHSYRPSDPFYLKYGQVRMQRYHDTKEEVLREHLDCRKEL